MVFHSCGNMYKLMDDLIDDVGIDSKHSFEDKILPVEEAYRRWGDRIAILGGVDMDLLGRGTEEAVRARTREILDACGVNGTGYCLGTRQHGCQLHPQAELPGDAGRGAPLEPGALRQGLASEILLGFAAMRGRGERTRLARGLAWAPLAIVLAVSLYYIDSALEHLQSTVSHPDQVAEFMYADSMHYLEMAEAFAEGEFTRCYVTDTSSPPAALPCTSGDRGPDRRRTKPLLSGDGQRPDRPRHDLADLHPRIPGLLESDGRGAHSPLVPAQRLRLRLHHRPHHDRTPLHPLLLRDAGPRPALREARKGAEPLPGLVRRRSRLPDPAERLLPDGRTLGRAACIRDPGAGSGPGLEASGATRSARDRVAVRDRRSDLRGHRDTQLGSTARLLREPPPSRRGGQRHVGRHLGRAACEQGRAPRALPLLRESRVLGRGGALPATGSRSSMSRRPDTTHPRSTCSRRRGSW